MRVAFFDSRRYEQNAFVAANLQRPVEAQHDLVFLKPRLVSETAELARGCRAVCSFVNDNVDRNVLQQLKSMEVQLVALRSAGFNHVDVTAAHDLGIKVVRVPEYSPYAVAEHAVALVLTLNRKIHRSHSRVRELNFSLDGLVGFDMHGKTIGLIGTGRIGSVAAKIFRGFGCRVLCFDKEPNQGLAANLGVEYLDLNEVLRLSDVISLHVPLSPSTHHMIDASAFAKMKNGVFIINTGRGALMDSKALIGALKAGVVGGAGLDVYEEEEGVFFNDLSNLGLGDDVLARLLTFPNVVVTSHQGFLTAEALNNIAATTLESLSEFAAGRSLKNEI